MKKIVASLFIVFYSVNLLAQNKINTIETDVVLPVQWQATNINHNNINFILIKAKINKGWHIFSSTPGGDGFLIPTTIQIVNVDTKDSSIINITDAQANKKPVHGKIEGIGEINYFENMVEYTAKAPIKKGNYVVKINYQSCNDKMCLPPQDEEFELKY